MKNMKRLLPLWSSKTLRIAQLKAIGESSNSIGSYSKSRRSFSTAQQQGVEPDIPKAEFVKMQNAIKAFSQCMQLGRYKQAQSILDSHKVDIEKYFDQDHPAYYSLINNQALLHKLNGNYQVALEMFQQVNEQYSKLYGDLHPSTINTLINLATVHKDLHQYEESIPLYEKAMECRLKTEGENSLNYSMVKAMAAGSYREVGKYDIADQYLKDAYMKLAMEFGDEDNLSSAIILNSMGMLYKKQNKFERGIDAYQRALKIRETQLGEDHPDTIATRHNIAELYIMWAKPDKAEEYLKRNIEAMEKRSEQAKAHDAMREKKPSDETFF